MTSILWILCTFVVHFVVSAPPIYVISTKPTIRLSDQKFEHIIKNEQETHQKSSPPDEKTLVRIALLNISKEIIC